MNRTALLEQLEQANAGIAEGEERIAYQRDLVHNLFRYGPTAVSGEGYLRYLESTQATRVAQRDLLASELMTADPE